MVTGNTEERLFFFLIIGRPPDSTLFPTTTLYGSITATNIRMKPARNWSWLFRAESRIGPTVGRLSTRDTSTRSEEHTSELQSRQYLVCRLLLEKNHKVPHLLQL